MSWKIAQLKIIPKHICERTELTLKPCESACLQAPEILPSECRLPTLSCWWLHWSESSHSNGKAASCARAAVPPWLPSNQGLTQLCKEVAQPHPVTVCLHRSPREELLAPLNLCTYLKKQFLCHFSVLGAPAFCGAAVPKLAWRSWPHFLHSLLLC